MNFQDHLAQNRSRRQISGNGHALLHPSFHPDNEARQGFAGHHDLQQGQSMNTADRGISMHPYSAHRPGTYSWSLQYLFDGQSAINSSEHGIDGSVVELGDDISTPSNFTETCGSFPPGNPPPGSNGRSDNQIGPLNSTAVMVPPDNTFTMANLRGRRIFNEIIPTGSSDFDSFDNTAMLNVFLSPTKDSFKGGQTEPWTTSSDGHYGQLMDIDFLGHIDLEAVENDVFDSPVLSMESEKLNPILPPSMPIEGSCLEMPGFDVGALPSGADLMLQEDANFELGLEQYAAEKLSHYSPCDQPLWNTFSRPSISPSTVQNAPSYKKKKRPYHLALPKGQSRQRKLLPKSTPYSPNVTKCGIPQGMKNNVGRQGCLSEEQRRETSEVRKIGACVRCKFRKTKCSTGNVCGPCLELYAESATLSRCLRTPLGRHTKVFHPEYVFAHLGAAAIKDWICESQFVYFDKEVSVRMKSGPFLSSISLVVREISPTSQDYLSVPGHMLDTKDQEQGFASCLSLPYALDSGIENLKPKCLQYINNISRCPLPILLEMTGDTPKLVWRSLDAVWTFAKASPTASQNSILQSALLAYWSLYTIGRDLAFSDDTVDTAIASLQTPLAIPPSQILVSSKVITRQIKGEMLGIYVEHLNDIVRGLESLHNLNDKTSSAISFSTNIILCIIAGDLVAQLDGMVIYNTSIEGEDPAHATYISVTCCQGIEEVLFDFSWESFFSKLRDCNPIKNGCDNAPGLNPEEAKLWDDFRRISRDLDENATIKFSGGASKNTEEQNTFDVPNSATYLSQFLKQVAQLPAPKRSKN